MSEANFDEVLVSEHPAGDAKSWDGLYASLIAECESFDTEAGHERADKLMCEFLYSLGGTQSAEAFRKLRKWYS